MNCPAGKTSKTVVTVSTKQTLTLLGNPIDTTAEQTMTLRSVNGQREADGTIRVRHMMESMQVHLTIPGGIEIKSPINVGDSHVLLQIEGCAVCTTLLPTTRAIFTSGATAACTD